MPIYLLVAACDLEAIDEGRTTLYIRRATFHGADLGGIPIAGGKIGLRKAAIGLTVGCGLLDRQLWARMVAMVVGAFSLVDMPFGTTLGIHTRCCAGASAIKVIPITMSAATPANSPRETIFRMA